MHNLRLPAITLIFSFPVVSLGQSEYSLAQFYGKELAFVKGHHYGDDTLRFETLEIVDSVGIYESDDKRRNYINYEMRTKFFLDSLGTVTKYRHYIYCPVGEWIPNLLKFEIHGSDLLMLVEYDYWGDTLEDKRYKEYLYHIDGRLSDKILLTRSG